MKDIITEVNKIFSPESRIKFRCFTNLKFFVLTSVWLQAYMSQNQTLQARMWSTIIVHAKYGREVSFIAILSGKTEFPTTHRVKLYFQFMLYIVKKVQKKTYQKFINQLKTKVWINNPIDTKIHTRLVLLSSCTIMVLSLQFLYSTTHKTSFKMHNTHCRIRNW